jgi:hypothetical protein
MIYLVNIMALFLTEQLLLITDPACIQKVEKHRCQKVKTADCLLGAGGINYQGKVFDPYSFLVICFLAKFTLYDLFN